MEKFTSLELLTTKFFSILHPFASTIKSLTLSSAPIAWSYFPGKAMSINSEKR